jgi:hypothetical protein
VINFFVEMAIDYCRLIPRNLCKIHVVLVMLFCNAIAYSQLSIMGTVTNENKKPLVSVLVSIHTGKDIVGNAITDNIGDYL